MLGAVLIEAVNGNAITMVVGGDESVLGFDYGTKILLITQAQAHQMQMNP